MMLREVLVAISIMMINILLILILIFKTYTDDVLDIRTESNIDVENLVGIRIDFEIEVDIGENVDRERKSTCTFIFKY